MATKAQRASREALRLLDAVRVVGVHDRGSPGPDVLEELALGACDRLERAEWTQVRRRDVRDGAHRLGCDRRELCDLTFMVHAHLDEQRIVIELQREQGQGQTDVVVQIPPTPTDSQAARSQDSRAHLLRRGLSVGSGDGHDGTGEALAMSGRQVSEGADRIVDENRGSGILALARDQRPRRALGERIGDVVVSIEALAPNRYEELPAFEASRVRRYSADRRCPVSAKLPAAEVRELAECPAHARSPRISRARRASIRSSNATRLSPRIW